MTKKNLSNKLVDGIRRVRKMPVSDTTQDVSAPRLPDISRFAQQSDQSPPASLDKPWENLHPQRIWPD